MAAALIRSLNSCLCCDIHYCVLLLLYRKGTDLKPNLLVIKIKFLMKKTLEETVVRLHDYDVTNKETRFTLRLCLW